MNKENGMSGSVMSTDNQSALSERDRAIAEFDRRYPTTFPTARRDIARAVFIEGWTVALAQAPAPSGEALLTAFAEYVDRNTCGPRPPIWIWLANFKRELAAAAPKGASNA